MNLIYTRKPYTIIMIFLLGFFSATASATTMIAPSETFPGESFTIIDTIEGRLQDGSVAIFSSASVSLEVPLRTQEPFKTAHGIVPITIPPDIYSVSLRQPDDTVIFIGTLTVVYDAEENPIPSLLVDIFSSATTVYAGDNVTLTVTETNDGNVNLESAYVEVNNGVGSLVAPPTSGDDGDGVLEPGETWVWTGIDVTINTDTTFSAIGHGIDPLGNDITFPSDLDEKDEIPIQVID
jgi:hypothetical protein